MGQEEVPGHVEAGGDGRAEQGGGGLEQGGAEAASINLRKNLDGTSTPACVSNHKRFLTVYHVWNAIIHSKGIEG